MFPKEKHCLCLQGECTVSITRLARDMANLPNAKPSLRSQIQTSYKQNISSHCKCLLSLWMLHNTLAIIQGVALCWLEYELCHLKAPAHVLLIKCAEYSWSNACANCAERKQTLSYCQFMQQGDISNTLLWWKGISSSVRFNFSIEKNSNKRLLIRDIAHQVNSVWNGRAWRWRKSFWRCGPETHTLHCAEEEASTMFLDLSGYTIWLSSLSRIYWHKPQTHQFSPTAFHPLSSPIPLFSICGPITRGRKFFFAVPGIARRNEFVSKLSAHVGLPNSHPTGCSGAAERRPPLRYHSRGKRNIS